MSWPHVIVERTRGSASLQKVYFLETIVFLVWVFKTRCSAAERRLRARNKGGKLSESREKRDEFLTTPRSCSSRGEPKAKLLDAFSLVRFFGASKEMNIKNILRF